MFRIYLVIAFLYAGIFSAYAQDIKSISILDEKRESSPKIDYVKQGLDFTISIPSIDLATLTKNEGTFEELHIKGLYKSYDVGNPNLPTYVKLIEIPHGARVELEVINYDEKLIRLEDHGFNNKLAPAQPSISKKDDPEKVKFHINKETYKRNRFYKKEIAQFEDKGIMRHTRIGRIEISPLQYNPVKNTLKILNNITVRVYFIDGDVHKTNALKEKYNSTYFNDLKEVIPSDQTKTKALLTEGPIKYVIVSDPMFKETLKPFVYWKTIKGFNVIEAYTDDTEVGTTTSSIKAYLKNLFENPSDGIAPSFVLFVGDVNQIPTFAGTTETHPTDLYYCEYTGDYLPEVFYGRFSAESIEELQPQIDKTLQVEKFTMADPSYLDNVVLVAGVDGDYAPKWGNGAINYLNTYYTNATNDINSYYYLYNDNSGVLASNDAGASADIRTKINSGAGFVNYTAHCHYDGWSNPSFNLSHIDGLSNVNKYPLIIGNCCLSSKFDSNDCFAESIVKVANKGAVAYIGGSNNTQWDEDYYWAVGLASNITANPTYQETGLGVYDAFFHMNEEPKEDWHITTGQMIFAGNLAVESSTSSYRKYYWEVYHVMGDPSLVPIVKVPELLQISHDNVIVKGVSEFVVTAEEDSYVALSKDSVLIAVATAGADGKAFLTFSDIPGTGTCDLVVTKQNRIPYITTVDAIFGTTPYVVSDSVSVNDLVGEVNFQLDYNDYVDLDVRFSNISPSYNSTNSWAKITSAPHGISVTNDSVWIGDIDFNSDSVLKDAFSFSVTGDFENKSELRFEIEVYGEDESSSKFNNTSSFYMDIHAPQIEIIESFVDDKDFGNNDQNLDLGEKATLGIVIKNAGNSAIDQMQLSLAEYGGGNWLSFTTNITDTMSISSSVVDTIFFDVEVNANAIESGIVKIKTMVDVVSFPFYNKVEYTDFTIGDDIVAIMGIDETVQAYWARFYDSGGSQNKYGNSENDSITFYPKSDNYRIQIEFLEHAIEKDGSGCYDELSVYNGPTSKSELIGAFCSSNLPTVIESSDPSGSLTFMFKSDGNVTMDGWDAIVRSIDSVEVNVVVVNDKNELLENAFVQIDGFDDMLTSTDGSISLGKLLFGEALKIEVSANSYYNYSGYIYNTGLDIQDTIKLVPVPKDTFTVQFNLENEGVVQSGVNVYLDGYGMRVTNEFGIVMFTGVYPDIDLSYTILSEDFKTIQDVVQVINVDIEKNINLEYQTYIVTFNVKDGIVPIANALCKLAGQSDLYTDANGKATFRDVIKSKGIAYEVSAGDYIPKEGTIVLSEDLEVNVSLQRQYYNVVFKIKDKGEALVGADVTISSETVQTDALGEALFELQSGEYIYHVIADNFERKTDTFIVAANDVLLELSLVPLDLSDVNKDEIKIRPNPTSGEFTIYLPQEYIPGLIQVFDSQGRELIVKNASGSDINMSLLGKSKGIYYIIITSEDKKYSKKIILQ